ncbi:MAG: 3-hydroxybutyryl-CoA dehydrogenase [Chryseobacterium sp. 39-10]|nr:3-hydroxybutyryl-CoA dehydrogenase [Chryseobacterium sp.]OJV48673.1 MAG: 3-hydroxybutyryl-CoA dehydrogenase [Chryseobacterium sp. 39-10]
MKNIGIIGAGTMGIGIAQVAASAGCKVYLYDTKPEQIQKSLVDLKQTLDRLVEKLKLSVEECNAIISSIHPCTTLSEFTPCDLVIEAIVENKEVKTKVYVEIESVVSDRCIISSNTSSISITSLSAELKNPERFIGIHFFNPAPVMALVEIIPGLLTGQKLATEIEMIMKSWGKIPVIAKDVPGFIVNRIARPFYGEALRIVEENLATHEQVDDAMRTLGNFRMGPFELMDLIGIDVNFAVTKTVYTDYFFDAKYKPSLLQQRMSEARLWGRKTGKGFYNYSENAAKPQPQQNDELYTMIFNRIISMLINEAVEAKRLGIADDNAIELAVQKALNYPKGLLAWGQEIGYQQISETLQLLYNDYQEERYRQSPLLRKL